MKTLIIFILLLIGLSSYGQRDFVSLVYMRDDNAFGVRIDSRFTEKSALYGQVSYGEYNFGNGIYLRNHFRSSMGYSRYIETKSGIWNTFSLGINFHTYGDYDYTIQELVVNRALWRISFEVGAGIKINRFGFGIFADPIKQEAGIYSGIYFN